MMNWEDVLLNHILDSAIWRCLLGILFLALTTASLDSTCYTAYNSLHFPSGAKGTYWCTDPLDIIPSFKGPITLSLSVSFLVSAAAAYTSASLTLPPLLQHAAWHNSSQEKSPKGILLLGLYCDFKEHPHSLKVLQQSLGRADAQGLSGMSSGDLWSLSVIKAHLYMCWLSSWCQETTAIIQFFSIWTPFCCVDIWLSTLSLWSFFLR